MSIPRSYIRKMADNDIIYNQGMTLSFKDFSYKISQTQFADLYIVDADFGEENCHVRLELDNKTEIFEKIQCSCSTYKNNHQICPHIVALLIKIENEFFPNNLSVTGDFKQFTPESDKECIALLAHRAEIVKSRSNHRTSSGKAIITPILHLKNDTVYLSFKIGCSKAYIVKDLDLLYKNLTSQCMAPCGKNDSFLYATENFQNPRLAEFFLTYYPLCNDKEQSKLLELTPEALEAFITLSLNKDIQCDGRILHISEKSPSLKIFIRKSRTFYRITLSRYDFSLYKGQNKIFILQDDTLYFCDDHFTDACSGLLYRFISNKTDPIMTENDMPTFYNVVLRPASRYMEIETENFDFRTPKLKTKIYIDMTPDKKITAKIEFHYGNVSYFAFDPTRDLQTVWDLETETKIENLIKTYFPDNGGNIGTAVCPSDDDAVFSLVYEGIPTLKRIAMLYVSSSINSLKVNRFPKTELSVRLESNLLNLDIHAEELSASEIASALSSYQQKKKYLRLKNGTFLLLQTDSLSRFAHVADGIGLSPSDIKNQNIKLPAFRALFLNTVTEIPILKDQNFIQFAESFSNFNISPNSLPETLYHTLRDYQKYGYNWLSTLDSCGFGGILADDMGLGKTIQILSLLLSRKIETGCCKTLVICPASLVLNWENESRIFTPSLRVASVIGTTEERMELLKHTEEYDLIITSYELLKRDILLYQDLSFDFEVIDEAQYIKNHNTQNARAVKNIKAKSRFALTGTPIENSIAELWSIFDYLMPGYLFKYPVFKQMFEIPIVREGDSLALDELKRLTSPFILRRLKKDVLTELPEKTESVLYAKLAPEQENIYKANLLSMQKEVETQLKEEKHESNKIVILSMLMKLRQICCDPSLLYDNYKEHSAKYDLCMSLIENSIDSGHKILVFSQFTSMLSLIQNGLNRRDIPFYLIQGSTSKEDRAAQVSAFNHDDTPVFLISLKAGGTGLNLTGADVVIHYDPWWNLSVQNQATDRAHRIGQKKNVSVYKLIAKNTIEEKILVLAEKKQRLADQILPDEGTTLQGLTKEEILDLFK